MHGLVDKLARELKQLHIKEQNQLSTNSCQHNKIPNVQECDARPNVSSGTGGQQQPNRIEVAGNIKNITCLKQK